MLDNERHERYCQGIQAGQSSTDAHENAGYKRCRQHANRLARQPHIIARIAELRQNTAERNEVTQDSVVAMLREDRDLARANKQAGAASQAAMGIAKVSGLLIDRHRDETEGPSKEKTLASIPAQFPLTKQFVADLFDGKIDQVEAQLRRTTPALQVVRDGAA